MNFKRSSRSLERLERWIFMSRFPQILRVNPEWAPISFAAMGAASGRKTVHAATIVVVLASGAIAAAQSGAKNGEWRTYGADLGNTRYSPLDQIRGDNFGSLEIAWRFKTEKLGPRPEYQFESTPLMVNGI